MEEKLAAGLGEWEIAEFVHDDEVEPGYEVRKPPLFAATCFRLESIDEIDHVEEATACTVADQSAGERDGKVGLSRAGPADQNDIVLFGEEGPVASWRSSPSLAGVSVKSKSSSPWPAAAWRR